MANDDEQQPQQPTDEEVGVAVLDAARYGDLDDLKELSQTYGVRHLGFQGTETGGNTALHYGTRVVCVLSCLSHVTHVWMYTFTSAISTNDQNHSLRQWPRGLRGLAAGARRGGEPRQRQRQHPAP